jgi:hypothetical protein
MARPRNNETGINVSSSSAAPARRKAAPRTRTSEKDASVSAAAGTAQPVSTPDAGITALATAVDTATPYSPSTEEISALAYSYYVRRGFTEGNAEEDWFRAEAELRQRAVAAV